MKLLHSLNTLIVRFLSRCLSEVLNVTSLTVFGFLFCRQSNYLSLHICLSNSTGLILISNQNLVFYNVVRYLVQESHIQVQKLFLRCCRLTCGTQRVRMLYTVNMVMFCQISFANCYLRCVLSRCSLLIWQAQKHT